MTVYFAIIFFTISEPKTNIRAAISSTIEKIFQKVVQSTEFCIRLLLRQTGAYFGNFSKWETLIITIIIVFQMIYRYRK